MILLSQKFVPFQEEIHEIVVERLDGVADAGDRPPELHEVSAEQGLPRGTPVADPFHVRVTISLKNGTFIGETMFKNIKDLAMST